MFKTPKRINPTKANKKTKTAKLYLVFLFCDRSTPPTAIMLRFLLVFFFPFFFFTESKFSHKTLT